jgi:hypothetical protein
VACCGYMHRAGRGREHVGVRIGQGTEPKDVKCQVPKWITALAIPGHVET